MDQRRQALVSLTVFAAGLAYGALAGASYEALKPAVTWTLALLIFLVGVSMGVDYGRLRMSLARIHRPLILVVATIAGALASGALLAYLLGVPVGVSLAIAAGSGWYSFTGPYLAMIDPYYGFVGFISNLLREIFMLVSYPAFSRRLGFEAISIGGATTMDSTLPVVAEFGGVDLALVAFIHGLLLTLMVPFLVPLLASLQP